MKKNFLCQGEKNPFQDNQDRCRTPVKRYENLKNVLTYLPTYREILGNLFRFCKSDFEERPGVELYLRRSRTWISADLIRKWAPHCGISLTEIS